MNGNLLFSPLRTNYLSTPYTHRVFRLLNLLWSVKTISCSEDDLFCTYQAHSIYQAAPTYHAHLKVESNNSITLVDANFTLGFNHNPILSAKSLEAQNIIKLVSKGQIHLTQFTFEVFPVQSKAC